MSNEPSRNEMEQFIVAQYHATAKQSAGTSMAGMAMAFRGALIAYASVLFYMRTGLRHQAEPERFKKFMQKMDTAAQN